MASDGKPDEDAKREGVALPREVQEHLGRRLRTALEIETAKPAFLGDASLPPEFDRLVRRLEAGERGQRQGYEAVKRALSLDDLVPPTPKKPSGE